MSGGDFYRLLGQLIRERVAVLVDDPADLFDWLDAHHDGIAETPDSYMTRDQARALGWLEGAAEALDMTVLEFVDANT